MSNLTFLADHCVPTSIINQLRDANFTVLRLQDYIPADLPAQEVLKISQRQQAILPSLNSDFADIISYPPEKYQGIIALQVRNYPEIIPELMDRFLDYLNTNRTMSHYQGELLLVEAHRIRMRS